ncbi:MAG TPA: helix-turn-helix domain-containing protein [Streptosporangiaceae bacterium]
MTVAGHDPPTTGDGNGAVRPTRRHRTLADAPSLQALTHPTRLALMEAIGIAGPLTATQASPLVGESPTACAYHLRTLARLGFIEETGGGQGRERPWRLAQTGMSIDATGGDQAAAHAAGALSRALIERFIQRVRDFELARSSYDEAVQSVTGVIESVVFATPDELRQLRAELVGLVTRYNERMDPALRPPGSLPFELVTFVHVFDHVTEEPG